MYSLSLDLLNLLGLPNGIHDVFWGFKLGNFQFNILYQI